jgi:DNA-binding MarR family transcriptional regulator
MAAGVRGSARRADLVSLTPHGRRLADQGEAEIGRRITALTDRLAPAQRAQLTQLAGALVHAQEQPPGPPGRRP